VLLPGLQCATLSLKPYQTQAKHSLTVPVSAGCIMMQFADFWENLSASSAEVLQCPRCSQVVAHPQGYCRYCKENAYQCCHCRSAYAQCSLGLYQQGPPPHPYCKAMQKTVDAKIRPGVMVQAILVALAGTAAAGSAQGQCMHSR